MTDVNIAVEMLTDAFLDRYDTALLISADSDLAPPIERVHQLFPQKRVVIGFPPKRSYKRLQQVARGFFTIGKNSLANSQFPEQVFKADGFTLTRPTTWK